MLQLNAKKVWLLIPATLSKVSVYTLDNHINQDSLQGYSRQQVAKGYRKVSLQGEVSSSSCDLPAQRQHRPGDIEKSSSASCR